LRDRFGKGEITALQIQLNLPRSAKHAGALVVVEEFDGRGNACGVGSVIYRYLDEIAGGLTEPDPPPFDSARSTVTPSSVETAATMSPCMCLGATDPSTTADPAGSDPSVSSPPQPATRPVENVSAQAVTNSACVERLWIASKKTIPPRTYPEACTG